MKKGYLILASLVTVGILGGLSQSAQATPITGTSTGHIELTGKIDPTDPDVGLTLDNVSDIDFGTHEIDGTTDFVSTNDAAVQVTDNRGNGAGWTVTVAADATNSDGGKVAFVDATDNAKVLKGAILAFPAGTIDKGTNISAAPVASAVTEVTTTAQPIMVAAQDAGLGTWSDAFAAGTVNLHVPMGNMAGDYTATLNWTLATTPAP